MKNLAKTISETASRQGIKLKLGSRGARTNKAVRKLIRRAYQEGQSDAHLVSLVAAAQ